MTHYYRTTDGAVLDLAPELVASLSPPKRDTLRLYSVDPQPTPTASQYVAEGPVVVDATTARKTWLLVNKSPEILAADAYLAKRTTDYAQVRQVYLALKNGTGTAAERLVRLEKVACRLIIDALGDEPA